MTEIKLRGKGVTNLSTWFKRFSMIDNSLLFEIDTQSGEFIGKTYSDDRAIVKMSSISFEDLGFKLESPPIDKRVKIGLYNTLVKINKILSQYASEEFEFIVKYSNVISADNSQDLAGLSILLKSDTLKVGLECGSLNIFQYISDEKFLNGISHLDRINFAFDLKKEEKDQILVLGELEKDFRKMSFKVKDHNIYAKSKSFELKIGLSDAENFEFPILKSQLSKIDTENYYVKIGDTRMVLESTDSRTISVIGMLNENEYDGDKDMNLD